jgi:DNA-binding winged helix-turn-helix (wHTH) protein
MRVSMTWAQFTRHECSLDGLAVRLEKREADLLAVLLVSPPDRFLSRGALIDALWPDPDDEPRNPTRCIYTWLCRLGRHGVAIERDFGNGWRIPVDARARGVALATRLAA